MKLQMAKNSLFAKLLRSPWWVSIAIAAVMSLVAAALLPAELRVVGALSSMPFVVIGAIAAWRQRRAPSAVLVEQTSQRAAAMPWPEFAQWLQTGFERAGFSVRRGQGGVVDFELDRQGRRTVVGARRWKSARTGLEALRALQNARAAADAADAIHIGLGELSDNARPYAAAQGIQVWQATELAQLLNGLAPPTALR